MNREKTLSSSFFSRGTGTRADFHFAVFLGSWVFLTRLSRIPRMYSRVDSRRKGRFFTASMARPSSDWLMGWAPLGIEGSAGLHPGESKWVYICRNENRKRWAWV